MTTAALERLRATLEPLIEAAAAEVAAEREQLERDAAQAVEDATTAAGIHAAYLQGRADGIAEERRHRGDAIDEERRALLALIEEARSRWARGGVVNMALRQLGEAVALR